MPVFIAIRRLKPHASVTIFLKIRSRLPSPDPCHSNCEIGDIWRAGARCVDDVCEYPPHSARRPLRHRDRHAETRARRGDGVKERPLERRLDRVLLRHGCHRSELERSGVPPLEVGEQLCLGLAPDQLLVKGDDRICSRLLGSVEPIEPRDEIIKAGSRAGIQVNCRHLEPSQFDGPKAAERVIEALDQRRKRHRWFDGAMSGHRERCPTSNRRRHLQGAWLDNLSQSDLHPSDPECVGPGGQLCLVHIPDLHPAAGAHRGGSTHHIGTRVENAIEILLLGNNARQARDLPPIGVPQIMRH